MWLASQQNSSCTWSCCSRHWSCSLRLVSGTYRNMKLLQRTHCQTLAIMTFVNWQRHYIGSHLASYHSLRAWTHNKTSYSRIISVVIKIIYRKVTLPRLILSKTVFHLSGNKRCKVRVRIFVEFPKFKSKLFRETSRLFWTDIPIPPAEWFALDAHGKR